MQDRHARMLRAAVVSAIVLVLSAGAHLGGGGILPHPGVFVGLAALTMLSAIVVAKRTLRLPALVAVLGGGQFALHHAFGLLSTGASTVVCASASAHTGHPGYAALSACTVKSAETHMHAPVAGAGAMMFVAHAIATLATAILIARGEEALQAVAGWLRPLFSVLRASTVRPLVRVGAVVQTHRLHAVPFLISPPLRGPPSLR